MIYEQKRGTMTIPAGDTVVAGSVQEVIDGLMSNLVISVPALVGTGTATILGTESLGGTIYASTAVNESSAALIPPIGTPTLFSGTLYLSATPNGTQSAAADIVYNLYYASKQG